MSDTLDQSPGSSEERCPNCDSIVGSEDEQCLMCGEPLINNWTPRYAGDSELILDEDQSIPLEESKSQQPDTVESILIERQSKVTVWLVLISVIIIICGAAVVLRFPASTAISFIPTETPIPPTITFTPSWTPLPSGSPAPSETPTITMTPLSTDTPQAPRSHTVSAGETLFGLGLRYSVSSESIAALNGLPPDAGLVVAQQLNIPWPTATPPLVPVEVEVGGQIIIADPTDCESYEIKGGDTLLGVASRNRIDYRALLAVNRLTEQSILQPGDEICIPKIIRGGVLPPTPGPSPTATPSPPSPGPELLLPIAERVFSRTDEVILLQWVAVKDLEPDEWYMVELTDLSEADAHPNRGFTRQTSFKVPDEWRPKTEGLHQFRLVVSIVRVTGTREDGRLIYTYAGANSDEATFFVEGGDG